MKRYRVIGKKRAVWLLLGAAVYFLVLVLGVGNLVASLLPDRRAPVDFAGFLLNTSMSCTNKME